MDPAKILKFKDQPLADFAAQIGLRLKRTGDKYNCLCPFHGDRGTPNLFIYPESDSFYCFACNTGGGKQFFIAKLFNINVYDIEKIWYNKDHEHTKDKGFSLELAGVAEVDYSNEAYKYLSRWANSVSAKIGKFSKHDYEIVAEWIYTGKAKTRSGYDAIIKYLKQTENGNGIKNS